MNNDVQFENGGFVHNQFFVTKTIYSHDEEGLHFKYQYAVRFYEPVDGTNEPDVEISMIPTFSTLYKTKKSLVDEYTEPCDIRPIDIFEYGYAVPLDNFKIGEKVDNFADMESAVKDVLTLFSNLIPVIDGMRGFILDRRINMLGSTGWDMVKSWKCSKSFVDYTLGKA